MTHKTKPLACVKCHRGLNTHSNMSGDRPPSIGTLMMCAYCGTLMQRGCDSRLVPVSADFVHMLDPKTQDDIETAKQVVEKIKPAMHKHYGKVLAFIFRPDPKSRSN